MYSKLTWKAKHDSMLLCEARCLLRGPQSSKAAWVGHGSTSPYEIWLEQEASSRERDMGGDPLNFSTKPGSPMSIFIA